MSIQIVEIVQFFQCQSDFLMDQDLYFSIRVLLRFIVNRKLITMKGSVCACNWPASGCEETAVLACSHRNAYMQRLDPWERRVGGKRNSGTCPGSRFLNSSLSSPKFLSTLGVQLLPQQNKNFSTKCLEE